MSYLIHNLGWYAVCQGLGAALCRVPKLTELASLNVFLLLFRTATPCPAHLAPLAAEFA